MGAAKVEITIKGMSPGLLMNRFLMVKIDGYEKLSPEEQAEHAAYRDIGTENLFIPGTAIQRALIAAATYSKGKGRASLQKQAAACLLVNPQNVDLGIKKYIIDSRPVVNPSTKGRIVRHRPLILEWTASFEIEFDDVLLKEEEIRKIVDDAGSRVGLLDFRPSCKGPFGRFFVTKWEVVKTKTKKAG